MAYEPIKSVVKALKVLELLVEYEVKNKPLTLVDVSKETGISAATARNILKTFEECGYANRFRHGMYEAGGQINSVFKIGSNVKHLREISLPIMQNLTQVISDKIVLSTIINGHRVELFRSAAPAEDIRFLEQEATEQIYRMRTTRVMLAWFFQEQLDFFIEKHGLPVIEDWKECNNNHGDMLDELKRIRLNGGIMDRYSHMSVVVVPVFSTEREIIASLGCYSPLNTTDEVRATGVFKILQDYAQKIRALM